MKYVMILFFALIACGGIWAYFFTKKVKREGIETDAAVCRIDKHEHTDSEGHTSWSEELVINYVNQEGELVEATLSNPKKGLRLGSRIRIRYLPDRQEYPVMTEILE